VDVILAVACLLAAGAAAVSVAPRLLAYQTFVVRTDSMAPAIPNGALVVVQPVSARDLRVGDVITYRRPERPDAPVTHRIIGLRFPEETPGSGPIVRTKGDANNAPDPNPMQLEGMVWRVAFGVPLLGSLMQFVAMPLGRVLFLLVPAAALGMVAAVALWRRMRTVS
jgi:signal peptidase